MRDHSDSVTATGSATMLTSILLSMFTAASAFGAAGARWILPGAPIVKLTAPASVPKGTIVMLSPAAGARHADDGRAVLDVGGPNGVDRKAFLSEADRPRPHTPAPRRELCATQAPAAIGAAFFLQLASHARADRAEQHRQELVAKGYEVTVSSAEIHGRGTYHRISLGPFASRREAEACGTKLKGIVTGEPWVRQLSRQAGARAPLDASVGLSESDLAQAM